MLEHRAQLQGLDPDQLLGQAAIVNSILIAGLIYSLIFRILFVASWLVQPAQDYLVIRLYWGSLCYT